MKEFIQICPVCGGWGTIGGSVMFSADKAVSRQGRVKCSLCRGFKYVKCLPLSEEPKSKPLDFEIIKR